MSKETKNEKIPSLDDEPSETTKDETKIENKDADILAWAQAKENIQKIGIQKLLFDGELSKAFPVKMKIALEHAERAVAQVMVESPDLAKAVQSIVDEMAFEKEARKMFELCSTVKFPEFKDLIADESPRMLNIAFDARVKWLLRVFIYEVDRTCIGEEDVKKRLEAIESGKEKFKHLLHDWVKKVGGKNVSSRAVCEFIRQVCDGPVSEDVIEMIQIYDQSGAGPIRAEYVYSVEKFFHSLLSEWINGCNDTEIYTNPSFMKLVALIIEWCERWGGPEETGTLLDYELSDKQKRELLILDALSLLKDVPIVKDNLEKWKQIDLLPDEKKRELYEARMMKYYGFIPVPDGNEKLLNELISGDS